jgi:C4-type Zn-finger protein
MGTCPVCAGALVRRTDPYDLDALEYVGNIAMQEYDCHGCNVGFDIAAVYR